ncbi:DUF1461 domain-containing protein [Candidatus Woesearchaeota archaeon]|nr:DUF1461 domain-containing protein [Candidatus Woesearchaeota archaeon]
MKFITISKFLLIIILPVLLFLLVLSLAGFNDSFFQKQFDKYGISKSIPQSGLLHEMIINFVKGNSGELPGQLNEREKEHLADVRNAVRVSTIILYILITLFVMLLIASSFVLKFNSYIMNFAGKVLVFGGFLTIVLAAALFFLIYFDFDAAFESLHVSLFRQGTYTFDPAKEMIVRLYPEELFMDLGLRISKGVFFASAAVIVIGMLLMLKSGKKDKNISK